MSLFGAGGLRSSGTSSQSVNEGKTSTKETILTYQKRLKLPQTNSSPSQNCSVGYFPVFRLRAEYARIQDSCHHKCINKKYYEGDLTTGEAACLDRCVSKFFGTHNVMNEVQAREGLASDTTGLDADSKSTARGPIGTTHFLSFGDYDEVTDIIWAWTNMCNYIRCKRTSHSKAEIPLFKCRSLNCMLLRLHPSDTP